MRAYTSLYWIALVLTVIGGLNWGLIGLMNLNLVEVLFGAQTLITRVVYLLVGLAALYLIGAALVYRPVDTTRPTV